MKKVKRMEKPNLLHLRELYVKFLKNETKEPPVSFAEYLLGVIVDHTDVGLCDACECYV